MEVWPLLEVRMAIAFSFMSLLCLLTSLITKHGQWLDRESRGLPTESRHIQQKRAIVLQ